MKVFVMTTQNLGEVVGDALPWMLSAPGYRTERLYPGSDGTFRLNRRCVPETLRADFGRLLANGEGFLIFTDRQLTGIEW